ncbi:MAG TPA: cytochrome c [Bryobacteraceae bacterium]|nr:cytochrome c [Bryobacteraceae bacterium]
MKTKLAIALAAMTIAFQLKLLPQAPPSVWDGIYTPGQADRGEPLYAKECAGCHGETLEGKGQTPPLAGDDFKSNWNGHNVDDLFEKIQTTMPAGGAGKLKRDQTAAIVAFMFKTNGYPSGAKELPHDSEPLESIRIEAAKNK